MQEHIGKAAIIRKERVKEDEKISPYYFLMYMCICMERIIVYPKENTEQFVGQTATWTHMTIA